MPSATANKGSATTRLSSLLPRTRPALVEEPKRRAVTTPSPRELQHGAPDLHPVPSPKGHGRGELLGVHVRAVGRAQVLDPQPSVAPVEAGVELGDERVGLERYAAAGGPAHGHLLAHRVGAASRLLGLD